MAGTSAKTEQQSHVETRDNSTNGDGTHAATTASQDATTPGDKKALEVARGNRNGGNDSALPQVDIVQQPQNQEKPRDISDEAAKEAARQIHEAKEHKKFGISIGGVGLDDPDNEKIINILEPQSAANRRAIEEAYEKMYGHKLRDEVRDKLGGGSEEWSKVEAILNRKDGAADDAGQVHTALSILDNASDRQQGRSGALNTALDFLVPAKGIYDAVQNSEDGQKRELAEADIRKTIGNMTEQQLNDARQEYKKNYGKDLDNELLNNPNLSEGTREALKVLLKGNDHRLGNTPEAIQNTQELANIGLKHHNVDIFNQAFQSASLEARKQFLDNDGSKKIDEAFSGDDRDKAHSYVERGAANIAMFVEGDTHWYHTNKDEITRLMENASPQDRQQYQRGMDLVNAKQEAQTPEDKQSVEFYNRLHDALKSAGSTDREVSEWESKLLKQEKVITDVLESHDDGTNLLLGRVGEDTDKNKLFGAVENMTEDDWKRFKQNPDDLNKLERALRTFATDEERERVMSMMRDKLSVDSFEEAKNHGRRSVDDLFKDNEKNPGARLDALMRMSAQEREAYKQDPKHFDELANQLPEGVARFEAQRILKEIREGKQSDKIDVVLINAVRNDNPAQTFRDIEAAFKADPGLRDRINNPQTEEDKQLSKFFHDAADNAAYKGYYEELAMMSAGEGGYSAQSEYMKMAHKDTEVLFQSGHMPLDKLVQLDKDKNTRYQDILNASENDKKRLLEEPPHDEETKKFQDHVFGSNEEKEMLRHALKQGKMDEADTIRGYVLGSETTPAQIKDMLDKMTPEQKQDLANEYYTKYHRLISVDVVDKVQNEEKFRFRELLSPTDVHVRQINLDARADLYNHTSALDGVMNSVWDKSKQAAVESNDNLNKFVSEHAAEIDKLTPEQRKQFMDAVGSYQSAIKNYVDSKGQFAEMVVDAAITVAALGGAVFTGGGSLSLLAVVGAGAAGAMFRVAAMRAIEGGDFNGDLDNISKQAFKGFATASLSFLGPEALGLRGVVPVGEAVAARTAGSALMRAAENGLERTAFRVSEDAAEQTLKEGISKLTRQAALGGGEVAEKEISTLATKVLGEGATAEQRAILEKSIRQELQTQLKKDLTQKVINESESLLINMGIGSGSNVATELAATGLGFESPDTLWERVKGSAAAGAVGGAVFHVGFKAAGAGWRGLKAVVGRDEGGVFLGKGTVVEEVGPDGKPVLDEHGQPRRYEVTEDKYRPKPNERVVENVKEGDPQRAADDRPPRRGDDVDVDGRPKNQGHRDRISEEFKPMTQDEFRASRDKVVEDLKNQKVSTGEGGKPESVYDRLIADSTMSSQQKDRVLDMLAEVREHYMSLNVKGKVLSDQEVNWIHTQGELSRVLESAKANKLSANETEDALIASMFSDSAKYGQSEITQNNFWSHHLDGALAASDVLARRGFPPERIDGIVQAIREHQIAPPEFMGALYRMKIEGTLNAKIAAAEKAGDTAQLEHLNNLKKILNSEGPEGMLYKADDGSGFVRMMVRQIADAPNQPLVKNGNGEWEVKLTPEQRELLAMSGNDGHWYVPKDPTSDPEFASLPKPEQERLLSQYKVSRALIDGDGIDNYATINGVSKIVKIRGPETFFKDGTVWDSVRSVDTSYRDAYTVLTPEGQRIAEARLGDKNRELFGNDGKFHDYRDTPPANDDHSAEAEMYRWLVAQGRNPKDGIPFYNEPLKYPKDGLSAEVKGNISRIREQLAKPDLRTEQRAELDKQLTELSGLNDKQWADYEFAKNIRDQMTDILRGQARVDGIPPGDFHPVRGTTGSDSPNAVPFGPQETPGDFISQAPGSGPHDGAAANIGGMDVQFYQNKLRLGSDFGMRGPGVMPNHAEVNFDPVSGQFKLKDNGAGTYVWRKGSNSWEMVRGRETTITADDVVRLGAPNGLEVRLNAPERFTFTPTNPDVMGSMKPVTKFNGMQDAAVFIGDREVPLGADGRLRFGRNDKVSDITDMRVSRDQGALRWNEADKSFYYTDSSTNGTYVRRGDRYERLPKGQEVKINPDDDIRLGSVDGPRLELYNKNAGARSEVRDKQVFFNGEPVTFDGHTGEIKVGRNHQKLGQNDILNNLVSGEHGNLKVDPNTGDMIYTDTSRNGSFIRRLDGSVEAISHQSVVVRPGEQIHLGAEDGPVLKLTETPGRKLPDGNVLFRRPDGDLIRRQDGTSMLDDRAGIRTMRDVEGNVTEATFAGRGQKYYHENGELRKVTFSDGTSYESTDGQVWKIKYPNRPESEWRGKMSVESDGSLRFEDGQRPPLIRRLDGSEEVLWPNGHIEYRNANMNAETYRLEALIKHNFPDAAQATRFRSMVRDINARNDISAQEKADVLHQINRLLMAGNDAALALSTRTRLAEQVAFNTAYPHLIDQGINKTCNVTTVETRAYQRSPADAVRLVTDVALTGKYTTVTGQPVEVARLGTLNPDKESLQALQQPFRGGWGDLKSDNSRSFASQIFEQTAVNVHYAQNPQSVLRGASVRLQPGDVVAYQKVEVPPGSDDTGERLVIYRRDANGRLEAISAGDAPNLNLEDIEGIYRNVVPAHDSNGNIIPNPERNIVWASPTYRGGGDTSGWRVHSEQQLVQNLLSAQQGGHLPIILTVNANHPVINGGQARPGHAWHVVVVQNIRYENGVPMIEFTNQWGMANNRLGNRAVRATDLFQAMQ